MSFKTSTSAASGASCRAAEASSKTSLLVRAFAPHLSTICVTADADTSIGTVLSIVQTKIGMPADASRALRLTTMAGRPLPEASYVTALRAPQHGSASGKALWAPVTLELRTLMLGGKGGFGSMLRAQGGKMSSNRRGEENNDACRDLNGRRLSTVKQARQLAAYLASKEERERELSEAQKAKYAKLEKMLGRKPRGEADFVEAATRLDEEGGALDDNADDEDAEPEEASGSSKMIASSSKQAARGQAQERTTPASNKRDRIEDPEYLEQSRVIVDNVRSAVASAMLKKKRKLGTGTSKPASPASAAAPPSSTAKTAQEV